MCLVDKQVATADGNVALAFGLVIMAGLSTTIGSMFVFCADYANVKLLAGALGVSAGVMIFVSFGEIYGVKAIDAFEEIEGVDRDEAMRYATFCFFGGIATTYFLDWLVHTIARVHERRTGDKMVMSCPACQEDEHEHCQEDEHEHFGTMERGLADINRKQSQSDMSFELMEEETNVVMAANQQPTMQRKKNGTIASTSAQHQDHTHGPVSEDHEHHEHHAGTKELEHVDLSTVPHTPLDTQDRAALKNMGILTAVAIAIHNFPEGLATFIAALADAKLGGALAIAIAIHNVPEGICVAMPVYYATGSKWKGFWWSFISGVTEPIGGLVGYLILHGNSMSPRAYGTLFGIVGGMMVYISLRELVPTALKYDPKDKFVTNCVFAGMAVMAASLLLFKV